MGSSLKRSSKMNVALPSWDDGTFVGAGRQRRFNDCRRHGARPGAGELLVVAGVVGEGHPHFDGLARVGGNKGVAAEAVALSISASSASHW